MTVEGKTHALPRPFFVIATQNPIHQVGTFPLPESQLDRFLMCIELGYPDRTAERSLLKGRDRQTLIESLPVCLPQDQWLTLEAGAADVHVSDALLDYLQALLDFTRESAEFALGLSPRAGVALLSAAKAWAFLHRRDAVLPEDVQSVLGPVAGHRLKSNVPGPGATERVVTTLIEKVAIP